MCEPENDTQDLIAEGVLNRVLRVAEEVGWIDEEIARTYGFETVGARGIRNRLAHAYGDVDREIIWNVIENDFNDLLRACKAYCDDLGIELKKS
ncbi:MAG: DUF86 domain-containing protein [Coriobacteriia bacterium]|nr:DUF86 domain-containing protein [Coriobacteriia bacterium]